MKKIKQFKAETNSGKIDGSFFGMGLRLCG